VLGLAALVVLPSVVPAPDPDQAAAASTAAGASTDSAAAQIARAYGTVIPANTQPALPTAVLAPPVPQPAAPASQPVSSASGPLQGTLLEPEFASAALGITERYFIYLPPHYNVPGKRYPVLYMLHGGGGRTEWINYGLLRQADQAIAAGNLLPMIIVIPQGDQGYWVNHINGGPRWGDYLGQDLVHLVDATYPTLADARHRAVGGMSMGGWGALYQAFTHPDEFGVVGAHAASLHPNDGSLPFLPRGDAFNQFDPLWMASNAAGLDTLRVWLDAPDQDPWLQRDADLHARLDKRHINNEWHTFAGKHGGSYWHDHVSEYLQFYARALASQ
jgi:enterochelin esterase-like enzyme